MADTAPSYIITAPDGRRYKVTGQGTPEAALEALKKAMGGQMPPADPAPAETPLSRFRAKYPQYDGIADADLAAALHGKFYADLPVDDFTARIGMTDDEKVQFAVAVAKAKRARAEKDGADMAARLEAAKAGTLRADPTSLTRAAQADAQAEAGMAEAGAPGAASDMVQAFGAGILRGAAGLADLPGAAMNAAGGAMVSGMERAGLIGPDLASGARASFAALPMGTGSTARDGVALLSGGYSEFQGETTPGRYAGTVGEFVPGAVAAGGGTAGNLMRYAALPGIASEAAGQATEGSALEPWARAAAAVVAPLAANAAQRGVQKLVSPYGGADPARLKAARYLEGQGVPVSAGQKVGSETLRRQEGFTDAGQDLIRRQQEAFTAAAMKSAGSTHRLATPEAMADTARQIGGMFDRALSGVKVQPGSALTSRLRAAEAAYRWRTPASGRVPVLSEILAKVKNAAKARQPIDGRDVAAWRSALGRLSTNPDAGTREAAVRGIEALDAATAGAMRGAGRAADARTLAQARTYWRNFLAVQKAVSGAGEAAASGIVTPSALRGAVSGQGRAAYAQGKRGDLGELARAGERILKPLPTSGTAENLRALMTTQGPVAALGAFIGGTASGGAGAALGAIAGAAAPGIIRGAKMTGPGQAYLANQIAGPARNLLDPGFFSVPVNALGGLGD